MSNNPLHLSIENDIAYLLLADPPKNAMGKEFFAQLSSLCATKLSSLAVRGMIVMGSGRHFSCGADLSDLRDLSQSAGGETSLLDNSNSFSAIEDLPFPVVAAISCACLGSGLELALACHYRIATRNSVLGLPETGFGLIPGCGGTVRLCRLIGYKAALRMIISAESLLAQDAILAGVVDALVEKNDLLNAALTAIDEMNP